LNDIPFSYRVGVKLEKETRKGRRLWM